MSDHKAIIVMIDLPDASELMETIRNLAGVVEVKEPLAAPLYGRQLLWRTRMASTAGGPVNIDCPRCEVGGDRWCEPDGTIQCLECGHAWDGGDE